MSMPLMRAHATARDAAVQVSHFLPDPASAPVPDDFHTAIGPRSRVAPARLRVLVPDGESVLAATVVHCLAAVPGVTVHVLADRARAPIRYSRHVAGYRTWNRGDGAAAFLEAVRTHARDCAADVVLPVDETAIAALAAARDAVDPPAVLALVPRPAVFRAAADKVRLAHVLAEEGIPHPATVPLSTVMAGGGSIGLLRFPVLIKPARGGYGHGIRRFDTPDALWAFLAAGVDVPAEGVVQEWFAGDDMDCSVLCEGGIVQAATVQRALQPGYRPFASPSAIEIAHDPEAAGVTASLMSALDFSGIAHVDLRRDWRDGRIKVIEINPRFWGSLGASFLAGVNFPWLACLAALGEPVPVTTPQTLRYFGGRAATTRLVRRAVSRAAWAGRCDASGLRFIVDDPLPAIAAALRTLLRPLVHPRRSTPREAMPA